MKFQFLLITLLLPVNEAWFTGNGRSTPSRDVTPPTITCIPNIHRVADAASLNISIWWDENLITVTDDTEEEIMKTRTGSSPGDVFSEGTTTITYHARDNSGNYNYCSFNVTVQVIRCDLWQNLTDGWMLCNVGYDMRMGTVCQFGCYVGHVLEGPEVRECLMSEDWDDGIQPFCQKIQCPNLSPSGNQATIVNISCTNENYYGSVCTYSCIDGYDLLLGHNAQQICIETGAWHGATPMCYDSLAPEFINCPDMVTGYAEPSMTSGHVTWEQPIAIDNSGTPVQVIQTSGPESGSLLEVGLYDVEYRTTDSLDNTRSCSFTVFVKQLSCPILDDLLHTITVCPDGRVLGAVCAIFCEDGTQVKGAGFISCVEEEIDTGVSQAVWDFTEQPYCEPIDVCPFLHVPMNGRIDCDTWELGTVCHMTCDEGYTVSRDPGTDYDDVTLHHLVLVCGDSGTWTNNGEIPDCQEVDAREDLSFTLGLEYGVVENCTELNEQILQSNMTHVLQGAFTPVCEPPACQISEIEVNCGMNRTSNSTFEANVIISTDMTSDDIAYLRSDMINVINSGLLMDEELKLELSGEIRGPSDIEISQPDAVCTPGSGYDDTTAKCVKCNAGYFYDSAEVSCSSCPKGYYQDTAGQTECIQCPMGHTTADIRASQSSQCVDACEPGFYSGTGVAPCSLCEAGTYTDIYGNIVCTPCPTLKTTFQPGASSVDLCRDFDIVFNHPGINTSSTTVVVNLQGVSTFTISLWLRCTVCATILTLTDGDTMLMSITNTDKLTLNIQNVTHRSQTDISSYSVWTKLTVIHTPGDITVYHGSVIVINSTIAYPVTDGISSAASLSVGGTGFQGHVTQVDILSSQRVPESYEVIDTCVDSERENVSIWSQFAQPEGMFVITNTSCQVSFNCSVTSCQNNGTCTDIANGFICNCEPGYTGTYCEMDTDNCDGNACTNNGTCIDEVDGYTCVCPHDYTGQLCELKIVNGGWTTWDESGACSVTCGVGTQLRKRVCNNPLPSNGGAACEGSADDVVECDTNNNCINECAANPTSVNYGDMNCTWMDNVTRACAPLCHDNYEFDNDLYLDTSAPICGPLTGYTWSTRTDVNPYAQIPSCTRKNRALKNTFVLSMTYDSLDVLDSSLTDDILTMVTSKLQESQCVQNDQCLVESTTVSLAGEESRRKRSSDEYVTFTLTMSCEPMNSISQCYSLLTGVINSLEDAIQQQALTIVRNGVQYNVGVGSTSVDGSTLCETEYVPVTYYCVPCGEGTYAYNNYCELCAHGQYQDEIGQTSCKPCIDGYTTEGLMTRDRDLCNVPIPESNENINWQIFTLSLLSAVLGILLLVSVVYVVWDRNFKRLNKTKDYSEDLDEPGTPPVFRFNMRNVWYLGKPVKRELDDYIDDEKDPFSDTDTEVEFDVVEDSTYRSNEHDIQSITLPETPIYGFHNSPFNRFSSPIPPKQNAWK